MSDLLKDFETFFLTNGIDGYYGRDYMPDKPDTATTIYEYMGENFVPQVSGALRSIQIVTRHTSAASSRNMAKLLYDTLVVEDGIVQLTPERWGKINLKHPPIKLKVDESNRVYYYFNLSIVTYND